jgi:hypothetical protein
MAAWVKMAGVRLVLVPGCRDLGRLGRCWAGAIGCRQSGSAGGPAEAVDWRRSAPSEMITLNALRIFNAAHPPATTRRQTS